MPATILMRCALCTTFVAAAAILALPLPSAAQEASPIVRQRYESGAPDYGMAYTFPTSGNFQFNHDSSGGPDGSGAAHFRLLAGRDQYNLGWVAGTSSRNYSVGDAVYFRFRLRFDDDHSWNGGGSLQNKFILLGQSRDGPQSRIILMNERPHDTTPCGLGWNPYDGSGPRWQPRDFGLNYSNWEDPAIRGLYSGFSVKVNIGPTCTPPVLMQRSTWYHVQVYARSSNNGTGVYKVWVNNNDFNSPNSQTQGFNLGTNGWQDGMTIGGFMSEAPSTTGGFRLDDVELGSSFDPNWAMSEAVRPSPPLGLRVD